MSAERAKLQAEALGEVARATAQRVELLDEAQQGAHVVERDLEPGGQGGGQGVQGFAQVAVVVQRVDHRLADGLVAGGVHAHPELPAQVLVQPRGGTGVLALAIVIALALARAGLVVAERPVLVAERVVRVRDVVGGVVAGAFRRVRRAIVGMLVERRGGRAFVVAGFGEFEQGVAFDRGLQFGLEFQLRELQQADGLPQLRRERQRRPELGLEGGLHGRGLTS